MKYLLDTCVLLWALEGNVKKLEPFSSCILDSKNFIFVSLASYWEIAIKRSLGRITFDDCLSNAIEESGFIWLNVNLSHIDALHRLPLIHRDPFDRILIAQSQVDNLTLLTTDKKISCYFEQ